MPWSPETSSPAGLTCEGWAQLHEPRNPFRDQAGGAQDPVMARGREVLPGREGLGSDPSQELPGDADAWVQFSAIEMDGAGHAPPNVPETAFNKEMTEHLGHEKNQAEPERDSTNVRDGTVEDRGVGCRGRGRDQRSTDRESTFEPQIVKRRQRRLTDVDEIVLSLYAKGMTTGDISAHFAEIYGGVGVEGDDLADYRQSRR